MKRLGNTVLLAMLFLVAVFVGLIGQQNLIQNESVIDELVSPDMQEVEGNVLSSNITISEKGKKVSFIAGGDVMFDRYIRQVAIDKGYGYALEELGDELRSVDFVLANLEGPVTDSSSISMNSEFGSYENYIFTFAPEVVGILKEYKFLVSLGNNHVLNFGNEGLDETIEYLKNAEIGYFGQVGRKDVKPDVVIEKNGIKIGVVNYNQFVGGDSVEVLEVLKTLRPMVDFLVVYTHWGNEYVLKAGEVIQELAYEFINNGADLVVGSHPHVVQQVEEYRGKTIYYSLGNFVFDQFFDKETMKGLLVRVDIEKEVTADRDEIVVGYTNRLIDLLPSGKTVLK